MYVYDFITSLDLLRKEVMPDIDDIPSTDVFIFGNYTSDQLTEYPVNLSSEHKYYLIYSKLDDITELQSFNIDEYLNYMDKLNNEDIDLSMYDSVKLQNALLEAITLLDLIASLEKNPFFDAKLSIPMSYLEDFLDSNTCEYLDMNEKYMGITLIKDIYYSQLLYFVKIYLKIKFDTHQEQISTPTASEDFSILIRSKIDEYEKLDIFKTPISEYTKEKNIEFENFMYQIELLGEHQLDQKRKNK